VADERLATELRASIATADVPPDELAMLINNTFRHGRMLGGSREVLCGQSDEEVALRLVYAKSGRFSVVTEPALKDEDARTLIRLINVLECGGKPTVWRRVLFASLPVDGFFRYEDRWQIRPVPPDAPQPPVVRAPQPFLLEVKGTAVSESFVSAIRGEKLLSEVQLVLALVLHGGLAGGSTSAHHEWVIETSDANPPWRSLLGQVGYSLPTSPGPPNELSDVSDYKPLVEVPAARYFERFGISINQTLEIPDLLPPLLRAIDTAPPSVRERFFRASYWFSRSQPSWRVSRSLSYVSLINAIEVLTPAASADLCPTCGLNRAPGPTVRFRDFVERYAGSVPERKELYRLRSQLVHGDQLLISDGPMGMGFTPQLIEESSQYELASRTAQIVVIAWLLDAVASIGGVSDA